MSFQLHHTSVQKAAPQSWLLAFHGVFGRGSNLRSFAKALTEARPEWGVELLDLREHGRSLGAPGPHTMEAAGADVAKVARELESEGRRVCALLGHSLGGKVALHARSQGLSNLQQTWVLDSSPSMRPGAFDSDDEVPRILSLLQAMPRVFDSRDSFVQRFEAKGYPSSLATWLAMNLERQSDGKYQLQLNLVAIRELLADYYADDAWPLVSSRRHGDLHVVVATRSNALGSADRARLRELSAKSLLAVHEIDAGHWLHVERPRELVELISLALPVPGEG